MVDNWNISPHQFHLLKNLLWPGTVPRILHVLAHLLHSHFSDREPEAERMCDLPRIAKLCLLKESRLELRQSGSRIHALWSYSMVLLCYCLGWIISLLLKLKLKWNVKVLVAQLCPVFFFFFCKPMDCSPPGSPVHGISRQEYWSGLPCPPPGDLPDPGTESVSPMSPALAGRFFTTEAPGKPQLLPWTLLNGHCDHKVKDLKNKKNLCSDATSQIFFSWSDRTVSLREGTLSLNPSSAEHELCDWRVLLNLLTLSSKSQRQW